MRLQLTRRVGYSRYSTAAEKPPSSGTPARFAPPLLTWFLYGSLAFMSLQLLQAELLRQERALRDAQAEERLRKELAAARAEGAARESAGRSLWQRLGLAR